MDKKWTPNKIGDLGNKIAIVTGTGGIGYEVALCLTKAGAKVILAGRNPDKGDEAVQNILSQVPNGQISFGQIDLASLTSIRQFCENIELTLDRIDILVNNAGIMNPPTRKTTADNFELQTGTNYLGPFALTAGLLPLLKKSQSAWVVNLSSIASRQGNINFEDFQSEKEYVPMKAYSQSKLAMLLFTRELQKQSDKKGWGITSVSAHPGVSRTNLIVNGSGKNSLAGIARRTLGNILFQPASHGAWATLFAATEPDVKKGAYYGPSRLRETRGYPKEAHIISQAMDDSVADKLWNLSIRLTHVSFIWENRLKA